MIIKEIRRKLFHLLSLGYASAYYFMDRNAVLYALAAMLAIVASAEFGRLLWPTLNARLLALFGGIHRAEETKKISGIFWTLAGTLITMALIPNREAVLCAMGYLIFGDTAAALVGVQWGRHKFRGKSAEGSLAFFAVTFAIGLIFFNPMIALWGAIFSTCVEAMPLPFNDNFWIPLSSALFLTFLI